jgi:hypothetical protein
MFEAVNIPFIAKLLDEHRLLQPTEDMAVAADLMFTALAHWTAAWQPLRLRAESMRSAYQLHSHLDHLLLRQKTWHVAGSPFVRVPPVLQSECPRPRAPAAVVLLIVSLPNS